MSPISRRHLIASGLALSSSSLLERSAFGRTASMMQAAGTNLSHESAGPLGPREQLLFDFGWKFKFGHGTEPQKDLGFGLGQSDFSKTGDFKVAKPGYDDSTWR